jgi:hypothetical protein
MRYFVDRTLAQNGLDDAAGGIACSSWTLGPAGGT